MEDIETFVRAEEGELRSLIGPGAIPKNDEIRNAPPTGI